MFNFGLAITIWWMGGILAFATFPVCHSAVCVRQFPQVPFAELPPNFLQDAIAEVDEALTKKFNAGGATGASYAVFYGDHILKTGYMGVQDRASNTAVGEDTLFRVMSVTKVVTSMTMLSLHDQGKLDKDLPAYRYMKELQSVPNAFAPGSAPLFTMQDLSMHDAGLSISGPCYDSDDITPTTPRSCNVSYAEIVSRWARAGGPINPPNRRPLYSNFGMAMLGNIIAVSQGGHPSNAEELYTKLAHNEVLFPLNMTQSGFDLTNPDVQEKLARAYDQNGDELPIAFPYFYTPSHGMYSTVSDMVKLGSIAFQTDAPILDPSHGRIVTGPSMATAIRGSAHYQEKANEQYDAFGIGWRVLMPLSNNDPEYGRVVMKFGYKDGFYQACLATVPSLKIGVAFVMTNGPYEGGVDGPLGMWDAFNQLTDVLAPAALEQLSSVVPIAAPPPSSFNITAFEGDYVLYNAAPIGLPVSLHTNTTNDDGAAGLFATLPSAIPLPSGLGPGPYPVSFFTSARDIQALNQQRYVFQLLEKKDGCDLYDNSIITVTFFQQMLKNSNDRNDNTKHSNDRSDDMCTAFLVPFLGAQVTGLKKGCSKKCISQISL